MYTPTPHRLLKNRVIKRRVAIHHYPPKCAENHPLDYTRLRVNRSGLTRLKHCPELVVTVKRNLASKEKEMPSDPHLKKWHQLLDDFHQGACSIERISEKVLGYDEQARHLRAKTILDCLLD